MKKQLKTTQAGFTLVELSLALAFISVLLIAICTIVINITAIYQKGLAVKAINSTGSSLVEEFSSAITTSSLDSNKIKVINGGLTSGGTNQSNGSHVFCTDNYLYAWYDQAGDELSKGRPEALKDSHLKRFAYSSSVCNAKAEDLYDALGTLKDVSGEELLPNEGQALIIRNFELIPSEVEIGSSTRRFYAATFTLATERGTTDISAIGCSTDGSLSSVSSDFNFCAINTFNFAARPAGGNTL